jgi:hypothetical protein
MLPRPVADDRFDTIHEALLVASTMDKYLSNLITNGKALDGDIATYRKGVSKERKAWLDNVQAIAKETRNAAKVGRTQFDTILRKKKELEKDRQFRSYAMAFKHAMEAFEDAAALCTKYKKKYDQQFQFKDRNDVIKKYTYLVSYEGYAAAYLDAHRKFSRIARKVGSMRT